MDISDLVHGMHPKKSRKKEDSSRGSAHASSPSNNETLNRQTSSQKKHPTPAGSSASHAQDLRKDKSKHSPVSSSSPSPSKPSSSREYKTGAANQLLCDLCERTFETKTKFDQHSLVFHRRSSIPSKPRDAPFPCPDCGKSFTSPSKRIVHQNATHKGLRPFQCEVCNKSFGYKGDLTKHMATHSGIKAHSCYICGARFARNFYVKRHIETVHEKKGTRKK